VATDYSDLIHEFATLTSAQLGLRFDQINKCLHRGSCANVCEKGMACGFRNLQVRTGGLGARTSQQPTPITFHTRLRVELSSRLETETVVRHHGEVSRSAVPAQVWLSTRSRAPLTDRSSLRPVNRFGTFAK
jgi:hypothetical protein